MPDVLISCPSCNATLKLPNAPRGQIKCPKCGSTFKPNGPPAPTEQSLDKSPFDTASDLDPPKARLDDTIGAEPSPEDGSELAGLIAPPQTKDELGRLGPYRVLKVLGQGGMGVVFLAEDPALKRRVALKAMLPKIAKNASAKERFLREAQAAAQLKHEHIVAIHQVGEDRGFPFLAIEFLEGESLDECLKRDGKLPIAEAIRIGRQIAEGLAAAHEQNLIHRDIKPANIWLERRKTKSKHTGLGQVKILDFGLAKQANDNTHLTQSGMIVGTPAYMPPEQAGGHDVDARADLYSLGVVLYKMVTGEVPFHGRDTISLLMALATTPPRPPRELNPEIPETLNALILKLLAKKAEDRPQSADGVAEVLEAMTPATTVPSTGPQIPVQASEPSPPTIIQPKALPAAATVSDEAAPSSLVSSSSQKRSRWPLLLATLFLAVGGVWLASQIIIRIQNKDGTETTIVPDKDAKVIVEDGGKKTTFPAPPPLPSELIPTKDATPFVGLLPDPPKIPGIKRWNVDTRMARGDGDACWSPDSKYVAAAVDRQLRIYSAPDMKLIRILPEHANPIGALAWSPDGKWLASVDDKVIRLHDPATGQVGAELKGIDSAIHSIAWSPDSKQLASAGVDSKSKAVLIWDLAGKVLRRLSPVHDPRVVFWHQPSGLFVVKYATKTNGESSVALFNPETGVLVATLPNPVLDVSPSPNGKLLITLEKPIPMGPEVTRTWDPNSGPSLKMTSEFSLTSILEAKALTVRPTDEDRIVLNHSAARQLSFVDTNNSVFKLFPALSSSPATSLRWPFSPDGKWVLMRATGGYSPAIHAVHGPTAANSPASGPQLKSLKWIAWSPAQPIIATDFGDRGSHLAIWNLEPDPRVRIIELKRPGATHELTKPAWSPDGRFLAFDHFPIANCQILKLDDGSIFRQLKNEQWKNTAARIAYSPDGLWFATYSERALKIGIWNAKDYSLKEVLDVESATRQLQIIGTPPRIATSKKVWDDQKRVWGELSIVDRWYSPDGSLGVTNAKGRELQRVPNGEFISLWDSIVPLKEANIGLRDGTWSWSPDSKLLAGGMTNRKLILFDRDGKVKKTLLPGHQSQVLGTEFAPDGSPRLASVALDHTFRIWNYETGVQEWVGVQLAPNEGALLDAQGEVRAGNPEVVERELIYLVETDAGQTAILTPTEFRALRKDPMTLAGNAAKKRQADWAAKLKIPVESPSPTGIAMVLIPPGEGVEKPFLMGKYEVTQGEWERVMGYNPSHFKKGNKEVEGLDTSRFPEAGVNWFNNVEFCNKLSEKEGLKPYYELKVKERKGLTIEDAEVRIAGGTGYKIPTDAEWTWACTAGAKSRFHFGNDEAKLPEYEWYSANSEGRPHAVGERKPNAYGLYDIHGNVREWNEDMLMNADGKPQRVSRGGYWSFHAKSCEVSSRHKIGPAVCFNYFGLRLARVPAEAMSVPNPEASNAKKLQAEWAAKLKLPVESPSPTGIAMVLIPPGEGVEKPFLMGKYEVTQAEWEAVMGYNPSSFSPKGKDKDKVAGLDTSRFPVEMVNWYDAVAYCNRLSEKESLQPYYSVKILKENKGAISTAEVQILGGNGYHVPTDAEWIWACMAGAKTKYHFGDNEEDLPEYAWFEKNSDGRPHVVGEKKANGFGLFDVHGNVREFLEYKDQDAEGKISGRGCSGGWSSPARLCGLHRPPDAPTVRTGGLGLRVARAAFGDGK